MFVIWFFYLYLNRLCEIGVLEKKTIKGHHYYLNIDLYNLLSEELNFARLPKRLSAKQPGSGGQVN